MTLSLMVLLHTGHFFVALPCCRSHAVMELVEKLCPHGVTITASSCGVIDYIYNSFV
jgi:hypothetical protein